MITFSKNKIVFQKAFLGLKPGFSIQDQDLILNELERVFNASKEARTTLLDYFSKDRQLEIVPRTVSSSEQPDIDSNQININLNDVNRRFLSLKGEVVSLSLGSILYHEFLHVYDRVVGNAVPEIENEGGEVRYADPNFDYLGSVVRRVNAVRAAPDLNEDQRGSYNGLGSPVLTHIKLLGELIEGSYDQAVIFNAMDDGSSRQMFSSEVLVDGKGTRDLVICWNGLNDVFTGDGNDTIVGYSLDDIISSGRGSDRIIGLGGNDIIDGGLGDQDIAVFTGRRAEYDILRRSDGRIVIEHARGSKSDGTDTLKDVEFAKFADAKQDLNQLPLIPYEDYGACPFECCTYRRWVATKETVTYKDRNKKSSALFNVNKGEWVTALTGVVKTTIPGKAKVKKSTTINGMPVKRGVIVYLMTYQGEGLYEAWYKGRKWEPYPDMDVLEIIEKPVSTWWVQIKNDNGLVGWSEEADNFDNRDACGGDIVEKPVQVTKNIYELYGKVETREVDSLQDRGGLKYAVNEESPFTGKLLTYWDNKRENKKEETNYKDGKRDELSTSWYENGQKKSEVNYTDGKGDGLFTAWYENGQIATEMNVKDKQDGLTTIWYENGQKKLEMNYKDGQEYGVYTLWYENGQKKKEGNTKKSREVGLYNSWYKNGKKESVANHKDGKKYSWYENGQKAVEINYKDGKFEGLFTLWYENGQKSREMNQKNDKTDGLMTLWYENGQKKLEQNYKDGKKYGVSSSWYKNGQRK